MVAVTLTLLKFVYTISKKVVDPSVARMYLRVLALVWHPKATPLKSYNQLLGGLSQPHQVEALQSSTDKHCETPPLPSRTRVKLTSTSTSPSIYLEFAGTMGVTDYCGPVESPLTSQLVAFPPGALSTYEGPYAWVGEEYASPLGANLPWHAVAIHPFAQSTQH